MKNMTREKWLILISFAIIYIVWGSTYLANWMAIQEIPPFLMSGSRFFAAGAILFGVSYFFAKKNTITPAQLKNAAISGIMFLGIGTGGLVWATQYISSALVALLVAFQPLQILLLMWAIEGKRPSVAGIFGTLLGMVGMGFLVGQGEFISNPNIVVSLIVVLLSLLSWAVASIRVSKIAMPENKLQSAAIQMLASGAFLLVGGSIAGEWNSFDVAAISGKTAWSWVYLVVFGSIVAYSAFNYLLVKSTPDKVATSNYVNPIVAMSLGWGLNNEVITNQSLLAAVLLLTGVIFIKTRLPFFEKIGWQKNTGGVTGALTLTPSGAVKVVDIPPVSAPAIARIWHGDTPAGLTDEYVRLSKSNCVASVTAAPGNLGLTFFHETEGEVTRHTFISYWKDLEAVKGFAGEDFQKPRFFPGEHRFLLGFDRVVEHRELVAG